MKANSVQRAIREFTSPGVWPMVLWDMKDISFSVAGEDRDSVVCGRRIYSSQSSTKSLTGARLFGFNAESRMAVAVFFAFLSNLRDVLASKEGGWERDGGGRSNKYRVARQKVRKVIRIPI